MPENADQSTADMIYIVDDDRSVRESLEDLMASVGLGCMTFGSIREFTDATLPDAPACLVLDVRMPGMSGLDFQRDMAGLGMSIPVVFITGHGDIPMSVKAMKAGAIEFLTKPFREQDLLDAISQGLTLHKQMRETATQAAQLNACYSSLTEGEREVMELVVQGLLNKQVAARLGVSEITVKVRRGALMRKMNAGSLAELVKISERLKVQ